MELGLIGLGRMGGNMAQRLLTGGHRIVAYNRDKTAQDVVVKKSAVGADSIRQLAQKLTAPRTVWIMVPAGEPTENTINEYFVPLLEKS